MTLFAYKALDINGNRVDGRIESSDIEAVKNTLSNRSIAPYSIVALPPQLDISFQSKNIKPLDLARFIKQLSTLISAGVSVIDAFSSLSKTGSNRGLASASELIAADLRAGTRLSKSLESRLPNLPTYVTRLAELGEATGKSAKALADASERMEFESKLRSEIRTALSYPIFLSIVGSLLIMLMFVFVVPRFETLLGDDKSGIPVISRYVIDTGSWVSENYFIVLFGSLGLVTLIAFGLRSQLLRWKFRQQIERLPKIGLLLIQADLGGWARTVGIALDNGADLMTALNLGSDALKSQKLRDRFSVAYSQIRSGVDLDQALSECVVHLDPLAIDLIKTGRISGQLPKMLLFIGNIEEEATRERSKRLAAIAEPVAILIISAIIGTIVISIVLAMTSIYSSVG